jgi:hypothetical protein
MHLNSTPQYAADHAETFKFPSRLHIDAQYWKNGIWQGMRIKQMTAIRRRTFAYMQPRKSLDFQKQSK